MSTYGLNVVEHLQTGEAALWGALERLQPRHTLIMSEWKWIAQAKKYCKDAPIFRQKRDGDDNYHTRMTPLAYLEMDGAFMQDGVIVQCGNESGGDLRRKSEWYAEVGYQAHKRGIRLALPNDAMGNPDEGAIARGDMDPLLQMFHECPEQVFAQHEYWSRKVKTDDGQPTQPIPSYIGRIEYALARAKAKGWQIRNIVIGEHGHDIEGTRGENGDGWRKHISLAEYIALLRGWTWTYRRIGASVLLFCWGNGFGWQTFNIEGEAALLDMLVEENRITDAMTITHDWGEKKTGRVVLKGATTLNVRPEPNTNKPAIASLQSGDVVDYYTNTYTPVTLEGQALAWRRVISGVLVGYVADKYLDTFAPVVVSPPAPPPAPVDGVYVQFPEQRFSNAAEALRHAELLESHAAAIRAGVQKKA